VLRPGSTLTAPDLQAFLAERIAKFKIPATIWFRSEQLPRNANGKFLKRELRNEYVPS
jgi:acyl-CoA synthetase (AMP-forming)/AMP-acid ligase II